MPRARRTVGLFTCTDLGLFFGVLLAWLASAAAGYGGDSESLSLVLLFIAGFPVSLPLCGFSAYFIALGPPILWSGFGAAVAVAAARGQAERLGRRILYVHYLGVLLGALAVPWAVESSAHLSAKSIAGIVLGLAVYLAGQLAWWKALGLLDRLGVDEPRPAVTVGAPELGRLAGSVLALLAAFALVHERATITIACRRQAGECRIERVGWGAFKRQVPVADMAVRFGVPRSRLEVGDESRRETLISVACSDRTEAGGNVFRRCESRGGELLATVDAFLNRHGPDQIEVVDHDPWRAGAIAGVLGALGLGLLVASFVSVRPPRAFTPRRSAPPPTLQRMNKPR